MRFRLNFAGQAGFAFRNCGIGVSINGRQGLIVDCNMRESIQLSGDGNCNTKDVGHAV